MYRPLMATALTCATVSDAVIQCDEQCAPHTGAGHIRYASVLLSPHDELHVSTSIRFYILPLLNSNNFVKAGKVTLESEELGLRVFIVVALNKKKHAKGWR